MTGAAKHIPSLDGLRAISIGLVLLGHSNGTKGAPAFLNKGLGDYGALGVLVFFAISGFLITTLLLSEYKRTATISLSRFFARRALRLFPALYVFLTVLMLLWLAGVIEFSAADLLYSATYTANFFPQRNWNIGHLWSLSVEEQFYLIWPLAFLICGVKNIKWAAAFLLLLGPVARSLGWLFLRGTPFYGEPMFPMVADSIAAGCALAIFRPALENNRFYLRLFNPALSGLMLVCAIVLYRLMHFSLVNIAGASVLNLLIAVLIHRSIYYSSDALGRFLNWKPLVQVGVLSYSLYIWQQPFLNRYSDSWYAAFPQNLGLAVLTAVISYHTLEKPFLRLRERLRIGKSPDRVQDTMVAAAN